MKPEVRDCGHAGKILVCMKELGDHKVIEAEVTKHITVVLTEEQLHTLYEQRDVWMHEGERPYAVLRRQVTEQDRALYSLCRPERLLEIMFRYTLFDAGERRSRAISSTFACARFLTASASAQGQHAPGRCGLAHPGEW